MANASLDVVDLKAGKLVKQVAGQKKAQGVAYAADLDRIFVGCGGDGACRVFDGKDYSSSNRSRWAACRGAWW